MISQAITILRQRVDGLGVARSDHRPGGGE